MNIERTPRGRALDLPAYALTPSQQRSLAQLEKLAAATPIVALTGDHGSGRSRVLEAYRDRHGGHIVTKGEILRAVSTVPPERTDDAISAHLELLLAQHDLLMIDDFTDLMEVGHVGFPFLGYREPHFARFLMPLLSARIMRSNKTLILAGRQLARNDAPVPDPVDWLYGSPQVALAKLEAPSLEDYFVIGRNILGDRADQVDFKRVFAFAAGLSCHQLSISAHLVAGEERVDTERFLEVLSEYFIRANTRTEEVEELKFDSLPGSEDIIAKLETHVVLPLENRELAERLELKPKRGVLLYGPPGTGKTSIGRALAHRMKGKFFLIDGSVLTDWPGTFFARVRGIIDQAKANAPAVVFIDDADVLFTIPHIAGFPRYLLSLLDGMESDTASKVCVMMTAMDAGKIPEALLRSGRVELWLETRLPDLSTRADILRRWMVDDLPQADQVDYAALASRTEGRTPADLRRLVADAKSLYAVDRVRGTAAANASEYLSRAVDQSILTRQRMSECLQPDPVPNALAVPVIDVDSENFDRDVLESPIPVLVDFWAPWCGPCLTMAPLLEELACQYSGRVKVVKLNCEDNTALANQYQVRSIPRLAIFNGGQIVADHTGTATRAEMNALVESVLPAQDDAQPRKAKYALGVGGMAENSTGCKMSGW